MADKKNFVIVGIVMCLAVVTLMGITYASFTERLTINGSGTVKKTKWEILFTDISEASKEGEVGTIAKPTGKNTTALTGFVATLVKPGSSISYNFTVTNTGDYNAKVASVNVPTPRCTGVGENATVDAKNVCDNLEYKLTYADGTEINVNDSLEANSSKELKLTLKYKTLAEDADSSILPVNDVTISDLDVSINYVQN